DPAWRSDAQRFEVGSLPIQDFVGMNAALELLLELGPARVESHVESLATALLDWALTRRDLRVLTPSDPARRAGIVALVTADVARDSQRLREAGLLHAVREGAIRIAPHFHNTAGDIARVVAVLEA